MKVLLVTMLLVLASRSACANWTQVFEDENAVYYLDTATISRAGNTVTMWDLLDFKTAQAGSGFRYRSYTVEAQFDCQGNRWRLLSGKFSSGSLGSGEVVFSNGSASDWRPVAPDSVSIFYWQLVCP